MLLRTLDRFLKFFEPTYFLLHPFYNFLLFSSLLFHLFPLFLLLLLVELCLVGSIEFLGSFVRLAAHGDLGRLTLEAKMPFDLFLDVLYLFDELFGFGLGGLTVRAPILNCPLPDRHIAAILMEEATICSLIGTAEVWALVHSEIGAHGDGVALVVMVLGDLDRLG